VEGEFKLYLGQPAAMEAGQALAFAQVGPQWLDDCATPAQLGSAAGCWSTAAIASLIS